MKNLLLLFVLMVLASMSSVHGQISIESSYLKERQLTLNVDNIFTDGAPIQVSYLQRLRGDTYVGITVGSEFTKDGLGACYFEDYQKEERVMRDGHSTTYLFFIPIRTDKERFDLSVEPDVHNQKELRRVNLTVNPFLRKVLPFKSSRSLFLFYDLGVQLQHVSKASYDEIEDYDVEFGEITDESSSGGLPPLLGRIDSWKYMTRTDELRYKKEIDPDGNGFAANPFVNVGFIQAFKFGLGVEAKAQLRYYQADLNSGADVGLFYTF